MLLELILHAIMVFLSQNVGKWEKVERRKARTVRGMRLHIWCSKLGFFNLEKLYKRSVTAGENKEEKHGLLQFNIKGMSSGTRMW